ncbi:Spo0E like sporulation regulatory protein [Ruminiclostridium hungatei]|uniref:Spo0E like sporulation regulatory protein n=1 Tax=Ruminiclostridium hungatei TaxID=48256 RepID=A0A1V4SIN6_RUMHU|nr:Spo0E family sporulation regulatory protein-aspartic acid phosphatase [Ruminiclostridium hungatei]OPX43739.1 Spo0E like sporulation regulatory protein [Ruminiclostridium hungatei]
MRELDKLKIKLKINKLRQEINQKIAEGDDLNDNEILSLSERLDILINQWYKYDNLQR